MEIKVIDIEPGEIRIDPKIIAGLMGFDADNVPEPYGDIIQKELAETEYLSNIKGGFRILEDIDINHRKGTFVIEDTKFEAGKQVVSKLEKSEMFALYICTVGEEISSRISQLMNSKDLLEAYITDITGTLLVEGAVDVLRDSLADEMAQKGLRITNRYSPGYCDWKVEEQRKLFSFFPEGFCGVLLSESTLMKPIKSVSGVIGIGEEVRFHKDVCHACSNVNCIYRNIKNYI